LVKVECFLFLYFEKDGAVIGADDGISLIVI
jgi:hypothetical protein